MKRENEIQNELNNISATLAAIPRSMPYNVPPRYFENFSSIISDAIQNSDAPEVMPSWSKTMPYPVPDQYFNELTNNILAVANLSDFQENNPYAAPSGYFETLPEKILVAAKASEPAVKETRKIPLKPGIAVLPKRWAAAAIILITIGLGAYQFFFSQGSSTDKILASVPASEIQEYLNHNYIIDVDHIVGRNDISTLPLENNEIVEYLNESGWD